MRVVLTGSGMSKSLEPIGDTRSGGVHGREAPEELVLSHPAEPIDDGREMSPSRARPSRDEDLEDFPEDPPRDDPPREGGTNECPKGKLPLLLLSRAGFANAWPTDVVCCGDTAAASRGDVLTDPFGCCTCARTSFQLSLFPGRFGSVAIKSVEPYVDIALILEHTYPSTAR